MRIEVYHNLKLYFSMRIEVYYNVTPISLTVFNIIYIYFA